MAFTCDRVRGLDSRFNVKEICTSGQRSRAMLEESANTSFKISQDDVEVETADIHGSQ